MNCTGTRNKTSAANYDATFRQTDAETPDADVSINAAPPSDVGSIQDLDAGATPPQDATREMPIDATSDRSISDITIVDATAPTVPNITEFAAISDLSCVYPPSLTTTPWQGRSALYFTCNQPVRLFRILLDDTGIPLHDAEQVGGDIEAQFAAQHIPLHNDADDFDDSFAITHNSPAGVTIMDTVDHTLQTTPINEPAAAEGTLLFPSGAALVSSQLCVVDSLLSNDFATYSPGVTHCFSYIGGTLDNETTHFTGGLNPTSVGPNNHRIAVLNANDFSPEDSLSSVTVFDPLDFNQNRMNIELGNITAQVSGTLAITPTDQAVIGFNSGFGTPSGLKVVDLSGESVREIRLPQVRNFISNVTTFENIAIVSDQGLQSPDGGLDPGQVLFVNLDPTHPWVVQRDIPGAAGVSVIEGSKLYVLVTQEDSANSPALKGALWMTDISELQR